jgi:hypothetical protein
MNSRWIQYSYIQWRVYRTACLGICPGWPTHINFFFLKRKSEKEKEGHARTVSLLFLTSRLSPITFSLSHIDRTLPLSLSHSPDRTTLPPPSTVADAPSPSQASAPHRDCLCSAVLYSQNLRYQSQTLVFSNLLNLVVVVVCVNCVLYCKIILVESSQICCLCESSCC